MNRERLDKLLVDRGLLPTRARAADAVRRGLVRVDGAIVRKPGQKVSADCRLDVEEAATRYVSRAALKLRTAVETWPMSMQERIALDLGASTGGFTQVLLMAGAARVYAVDVGHGQLHPDLAADPRVVSLEGVNVRDLSTALIPEAPDVITADLSFISLSKALPAALALAAPGARLYALIKPQFEAGRERLGKGGIVRDPAVHQAVISQIRDFLENEAGWTVLGVAPSPLPGREGNREFLIAADKPPSAGKNEQVRKRPLR